MHTDALQPWSPTAPGSGAVEQSRRLSATAAPAAPVNSL
jgi:hypothetical protein